MIDAAADPGVGFNWDFFPFMQTLRDAVGGGLAAALVISVAVIAFSGVMWGAGKLSGSRGMQNVGFGGVCIALLVTVVIGAANAMAGWGAGVDTGF